MKIFIVENVSDLTSNYHPEGGLVVVAKDLEAAKALAPSTVTEKEWASATVHELKYTRGVDPKAFIFPDAGCC